MNRRIVATVVLPLITIAVVTIILLSFQDRLPDEVATHWGANGEADGFTSKQALPWLTAALMTVVVAPIAVISTLIKAASIAPRLLSSMPLWIAGLVGGIVVLSTSTQLDTADSAGAPEFQGWIIPASLSIAFAAGLIGALVAGRPPTPPETTAPAAAGAERFPLAEGQTAVWTGRTPTGSSLIIAAALVSVILVVAAALTTWWLLAFLAFLLTMLIASTSFAVTAGPAGVRVAGLIGFPRMQIPLPQITAAESGTVRAFDFGGWGLRVGLNGDGAIITRSGPALVITRTDGARIHVSLDEPEQPAAVISTLLDRRA